MSPANFVFTYLKSKEYFIVITELISNFDGGERQMYGENATAHIFTSFPRDDLSKTTGFFDIVSPSFPRSADLEVHGSNQTLA